MEDAIAGRRGRRLKRLFETFAVFDRHYLIDFQIVVYMKLPLAALAPFAPPGTRPYRVDESHGLFYVTYMRMKAGNMVSEAHPNGLPRFEELLWGIRVQPVSRKPYLPVSLAANALTTTSEASREVLRQRDKYLVHDLEGLDLRFDPDRLKLSAEDASARFFSIDLSRVMPSDRRWMLTPQPTEVFLPPHEAGARPLRYEFVGLGLLQFLRGADLPDGSGAFELRAHDFFRARPDGGASRALFPSSGDVGEARLHEIIVSRPDTAGLQMLTPSKPHAGKESH